MYDYYVTFHNTRQKLNSNSIKTNNPYLENSEIYDNYDNTNTKLKLDNTTQ